MPLKGEFGSLSSLHRTDAQRPQTCLSSTQALRSRRMSSASKSPNCIVAHRSDRSDPLVRPVRCCCTSVFGSSVLALWINQGTQWFSGEPPETPRTRCSLRQSPLMTRLPCSPGSTLVLRLNQETVHDFILLFMPPCGPHLTPLATGSLEPSLLVFSTPGGLTGDDLSRLFFTYQSSCNLHLQYLAKNQSTQHCQSLITPGSDHPPVLEPHMVLNLPLDECIDNTHIK
jgi:hypothetical protein